LAWWCALHALLVAAALLVGWPWALRLAALVAVAGHAIVRWPRATPASVLVYSDATCLVPKGGPRPIALGPRTVVCAYWIRLDLGVDLPQRDILLVIDQVGPDQWARLRALLERARVRRGARSAAAEGTNLS